MADSRGNAQARLIARLSDPAFHGPHCRAVRVLETHISSIVLTGTFAYKIKKAIDLGFVDFTSLAARRFFCQEEIRLNRRLAPSLYLDVVAITGTPDRPQFGGAGAPFEFAVRMREFPQAALLPAALARGALTVAHVKQLAVTIEAFHRSAATALPHTRFGTPADVEALAVENIVELQQLTRDSSARHAIGSLRDWSRREFTRLADVLTWRRHRGFVRECHGDLHLGNIALLDDVATPFDCIEFNERMRWSDVMSDVAFLTMDLHAHGRADLANLFLNQYLEEGGDYAGLDLLRFFVVYRALVRAKVSALRAGQTVDQRARANQAAETVRFVRVAASAARSRPAGIIILHGLSGSGKTNVARALAASIGGIHVRADVERKRLFRVPKLARTGASIGTGIYSDAANRQTYDRLAAVARTISSAGYVAIADAAFLKRWQREQFRSLATAMDMPFAIIDCAAPTETLTERIASRERHGHDASEADMEVLVHQMATAEPLDAGEHRFVVPCDTTSVRAGQAPRGLVEGLTQRIRLRVTPSPSTPDRSRGG